MYPDRSFLVGVLLALPVTSTNAAMTQPPNPYVDKGACPFECCTYRDWKTTKPITLVNRPNGHRSVARVAAGNTVHAITGEVISTPLRVVAPTSYADSPIKKGDAFYVLHYAGEGFSHVWFEGKSYDVELDQSGATVEGPRQDGAAWWAQIRTRNGKSGWVLVKDQFENQDACA